MIYSIGFFILGTVLWIFNHNYNPAVDYGLGLILLGLSISTSVSVKDPE